MSYRIGIIMAVICVAFSVYANESITNCNSKELLEIIRGDVKSHISGAVRQLYHQRKETSQAVVEILEDSDRKKEEWLAGNDLANIAIYIAGELRLVDAIPQIIERLQPAEDKFYLDASTPIRYPPAATALMKIGIPAVPAVIEAAKQAPRSSKLFPDRFSDFDGGYPGVIESILSEIGGHEFAVWTLEKAIANEQNEGKRSQLQKTLAISEKRLKHEVATK